MLMRSMPSVYSAMRGSGITTSSLILKALVWRLMAAVRLRVEPELLARLGADGDKTLAGAELAMRTTSLVARATASASSPADVAEPAPSWAAGRLLLVA